MALISRTQVVRQGLFIQEGLVRIESRWWDFGASSRVNLLVKRVYRQFDTHLLLTVLFGTLRALLRLTLSDRLNTLLIRLLSAM